MSYNKLKSLVANVEAIETAMKIQVQGRQATAEEKEILSRYSGFGGIKEVLNIGTDKPIGGDMQEPIQRLQELINAYPWGDNVVDIVIYGTEKTLDAYKFNLLKNKQMFINQINNGTIAVRRIDEGGMDEDSGMNFAEFVAILSGNNDLLNKTKLDNKIMQLEKEQAIFKKERIRAERKITAGQEDMAKTQRTKAGFIKDWEYFNSYEGTKVTQLLNLPQATAEETGRELHRIAKTYRSGAYGTIGTFTGLNLLVRSEYSINGTFDRNTFFVEGTSGLKYRCGLTGALPLGFVESAQYPQATLNKLPSLIEKQQKTVERIESEIPILQDIVGRQWSKADELVKLKLECKELQRKIDESLKDAERSLTPSETTAAEYEPTTKAA